MPWPHCSASPTSSQWFQHVQWRSHLSTARFHSNTLLYHDVTPKHTVSCRQLVPYIDTHNISRWIHDPRYHTMGWFPSPFSTYLASDSMANAVFDHNYVNNKQILLLSKCKIYRLACNRTYAHRIPDIIYLHADIECQMPCWRIVNMRGEDRLHT